MSDMDKNFAESFAEEWIRAWNSHDLEQILSHYADDFEMSSPKIISIAGEPSGTLKGRKAIGPYWSKALALRPALHFELIRVFTGVDSVTIHYSNDAGQSAAEVFHFDSSKRVVKAFAHYA
ncbi:MAG: nuclear transport factor 2 family protein [Candidatus Wallbacteria bacterium]|nr:nuclear transport factor 2 family protein [Candidatus Wallbacteria bacterium]